MKWNCTIGDAAAARRLRLQSHCVVVVILEAGDPIPLCSDKKTYAWRFALPEFFLFYTKWTCFFYLRNVTLRVLINCVYNIIYYYCMYTRSIGEKKKTTVRKSNFVLTAMSVIIIMKKNDAKKVFTKDNLFHVPVRTIYSCRLSYWKDKMSLLYIYLHK